MPSLWRRLWPWPRREQRAPELRVVVYTRARCPLCDKAAAFLDAERRRLGFRVEYIDIDSDAALRERYTDWVPVVEVNGQVRFRGRINPVLWARLMTAICR